MRLGIMGGTFDPIHIGHLILGEHAWQQLKLDRVDFMPAGNPPHKQNREGRASNEERMAMVRAAVADNPHFAVSGREMTDEGYTYTYRTLEGILSEAPDTEIFFILGADSLFDFDKWRSPERICRACTLVAAVRNHTPKALMDEKMQEIRERYNADIVKLDTENIDVSSGMIRMEAAAGRTIRYYVPEAVRRYIETHNIYGNYTLRETEV